MVFWGALTCVTSIIIWLLWTATDNPSWNALWFLMAITGWSIMTVKMKKQRGRPSNILSKILCVSWMSFGLFAMVTAILGTISLNSLHYAGKLPIASVLILLLGLTGMTTGLLLRNKIIVLLAIISIFISNSALMHPGPYDCIAICATSLILLIIPGIIINRIYKKDNGHGKQRATFSPTEPQDNKRGNRAKPQGHDAQLRKDTADVGYHNLPDGNCNRLPMETYRFMVLELHVAGNGFRRPACQQEDNQKREHSRNSKNVCQRHGKKISGKHLL